MRQTLERSETRRGVTQDRLDSEPEEAVQASNRKRQRTSFDLLQSRESSEREERIHWTTAQFEEAIQFRDDRIRSLENEKEKLKDENKALNKRLSKICACPICNKSYNRSDSLLSHLNRGDEAHRRLAQERSIVRKTKCEDCGKAYTRPRDLDRHYMARHGQKKAGSTVEVNHEPDTTIFLSPTRYVTASTPPDAAPSTTSLDGPQDSILETAWPYDASHPFSSADTVQSPGDQAVYGPPLTPRTQALVFTDSPARRLNSTHSGPVPHVNTDIVKALGFSNSPARGLQSTPPGYTYCKAPGFLNCPARGLDFTAGYMYPTPNPNHTPTVQTQSFSYTTTPSSYTHLPFYHADSVAVQAPLGSRNPARGPNSTLPGYTDSLLNTNSVMQAPGFSNYPTRRLDSTHPHCTHEPYSNDTLQTPTFSGLTAGRSDLALHASLYNTVA